jgi:large subunit ribosomal protein L18
MSVCFTGKHIYVQFVDDQAGKTLAAASTRAQTLPEGAKPAANVTSAKQIGQQAAQFALSKGIQSVVFDRGSARYHGKVKALADAAREAGLKF